MPNIVEIKSKQGFSFKIIAELLQNYIEECCFVINDKGMKLCGVNKMATKLVYLDLPRENFNKFKCPSGDTNIGINFSFFYQMLKSTKKSTTLTLFIDEKDKLHLGIKQKQNDINPRINTIPILDVNVISIKEEFDRYDKYIVITSKEFAQLKPLNKVHKSMKLNVFTGNKIEFSVTDTINSTRIPFGCNDSDTDDSDDEDNSNQLYTQTYESDEITQLVKVASLSDNIQIYPNQNAPLLFNLQVSSLGTLRIYIKSKELQDYQQKISNTINMYEEDI